MLQPTLATTGGRAPNSVPGGVCGIPLFPYLSIPDSNERGKYNSTNFNHSLSPIEFYSISTNSSPNPLTGSG